VQAGHDPSNTQEQVHDQIVLSAPNFSLGYRLRSFDRLSRQRPSLANRLHRTMDCRLLCLLDLMETIDEQRRTGYTFPYKPTQIVTYFDRSHRYIVII
jgi:hypothetical protein